MNRKCNFKFSILKIIFRNYFKTRLSSRSKLDLTSFGTKEQLIDLCSQIETYLSDNSRLAYPVVYFRTDLFKEQQTLLSSLQQIVKKHNGQIVDKAGEADRLSTVDR